VPSQKSKHNFENVQSNQRRQTWQTEKQFRSRPMNIDSRARGQLPEENLERGLHAASRHAGKTGAEIFQFSPSFA
jgi:hypothetical protein